MNPESRNMFFDPQVGDIFRVNHPNRPPTVWTVTSRDSRGVCICNGYCTQHHAIESLNSSTLGGELLPVEYAGDSSCGTIDAQRRTMAEMEKKLEAANALAESRLKIIEGMGGDSPSSRIGLMGNQWHLTPPKTYTLQLTEEEYRECQRRSGVRADGRFAIGINGIVFNIVESK